VAAERECCAWAEWALDLRADGWRLVVTGPAEPIRALAGTLGAEEATPAA
jgi:hypothetical protein